MHVCVGFALLLSLGSIVNATNEFAPDEAWSPTWQPSAVALEAVGLDDMDRFDNQAVFVEELGRTISRDDLTASDKADALAVMLSATGDRFNGIVWLPPNMAYIDVYWDLAERLVQARNQLAALDIDIASLVDLVKRTHAKDAIRSGHALVLVAMLDPEDAKPLVEALTDPARLKRSQVPPITIHYQSLAVVLVDDDALTERFLGLLPEVPFEESREDIICAVGFGSPPPGMLEAIADFVRASVAADELDLDTLAGLTALRRRMDQAAFTQLLDGLIEAASEASRETLAVYRTGEPPRGGLGEPPTAGPDESVWLVKQWDGFTATRYRDGTRIEWGETYSDFLAR